MLSRIVMVSFFALFLASGVGSCSLLGMEDPAELRAQAADANAQAAILLGEVQALRDEAAGTTGDDAAKLLNAASKIETAADALRVAGSLAEQGADAIENQDFGPLVKTFTDLIPPPFGSLAGVAGTLFFAHRERRQKTTTTQIVTSLMASPGRQRLPDCSFLKTLPSKTAR